MGIIRSGVVSGATYELKNPNSGKMLDVSGNSTANGANVQIWQSTGGTNQQWIITKNGDGTYRMIGVQSGKALDVLNGGLPTVRTCRSGHTMAERSKSGNS